MKALLAHPGTQHSFKLARELDDRGALQFFYTGLAWRWGDIVGRLAGSWLPGINRPLRNRTMAPGFHADLRRRPLIELRALLRLRLGEDEQKVIHQRNYQFQRSIPDKALEAADVVISFDTASWILVQRCRELSRPFVLDQSIGHPDAKQVIHDRMRKLFPEWDEGFEIRRAEVRSAEIIEQRESTAIVTASSFTKQTLVDHGVFADKIHVIPYGVDAARFIPSPAKTSRPFRFVFLGLVTVRKGIPLLFQAWRALGKIDAELWLIGSASKQARALIPNCPRVRSFGSVPHIEIPRLLQECDVLVFPSFFEGFGLVILEAMACGLPVITTAATGGPDIITQGQDGWIIESGNLDVLAGAMQFCMESQDRVAEMRVNARATAKRFSWHAYGNRWLEILQAVARKA